MIHTEEDDEFTRIEHEIEMKKGQPYYFDPSNNVISADKNDPRFTPLGQVWPVDIKREWVGLTDEDLGFLFPHGKSVWIKETVKIIEAKLKEKNT